MARPLRIEYPGALYHVTSRGNERLPIVLDDHDRLRRIDWLRRAVEMFGWRLHAFVLMADHDHLFVETPEPTLRYCAHEAAEQAMRYQRRRDVLCDCLERAGWEAERPRASMFVWARIPKPYDRLGSVKFSFSAMEKAMVAVAPGAGFGEAGWFTC